MQHHRKNERLRAERRIREELSSKQGKPEKDQAPSPGGKEPMFTLEELYIAEEQVRDWHAQRDDPYTVKQVDSQRPTYTRPAFLAGFRRWLRAGTRSRRAPGPEAISTLSILDAVAHGELSPKAAHRLLHARISTLALLQSVAWGEISPKAARHLLG
jgi:hypothetical protein